MNHAKLLSLSLSFSFYFQISGLTFKEDRRTSTSTTFSCLTFEMLVADKQNYHFLDYA
jgi:hypothetical protein